MEKDLILIENALGIERKNPNEYSPLALAYIGDAIYEVVIRTLVMSRGSVQLNKMHNKTASLVKADAQAKLYMSIEESLTEEEKAIYRRGRNAHSGTMPKHATMKDYRMATGFEALMGYLYLSENMERVTELCAMGLKAIGEIS